MMNSNLRFLRLLTAYCSLSSQRLSPGEAGFEVVPPLDALSFAALPAEEDDAPVAHGREVDEAALVVFDLHAEGFELARILGEVVEGLDVLGAARHSAAAELRALRSVARRLLLLGDVAVGALDGPDHPAHGRQQRVRFLDGKELHKSRQP